MGWRSLKGLELRGFVFWHKIQLLIYSETSFLSVFNSTVDLAYVESFFRLSVRQKLSHENREAIHSLVIYWIDEICA